MVLVSGPLPVTSGGSVSCNRIKDIGVRAHYSSVYRSLVLQQASVAWCQCFTLSRLEDECPAAGVRVTASTCPFGFCLAAATLFVQVTLPSSPRRSAPCSSWQLLWHQELCLLLQETLLLAAILYLRVWYRSIGCYYTALCLCGSSGQQS